MGEQIDEYAGPPFVLKQEVMELPKYWLQNAVKNAVLLGLHYERLQPLSTAAVIDHEKIVGQQLKRIFDAAPFMKVILTVPSSQDSAEPITEQLVGFYPGDQQNGAAARTSGGGFLELPDFCTLLARGATAEVEAFRLQKV